MDVYENPKESHPQKHFLKFMCRLIYYMGMGDYWYEDTCRSKTHKTVYAIWAGFINSYLILNTLNELLANFRSDLTFKEKNDLYQFCLAHPPLITKYTFLILQKQRVRELFKRLVEDSSATYRSLKFEKKSVKDAIWYFVGLCIAAYGTLLSTTVDGFRASHKEGMPFKIEVTLVPKESCCGIVSFFRAMIEIHWWLIVTNMVLVDGLVFISLVYLGYKFRLVCEYFNDLRDKTLKNIMTKTRNEAETGNEFEKDFVTGIKLHDDALWCSQSVQDSLGNIYGVQIVETITLLVICLVKLVSLERNMTFLLANSFFIASLLVLNGAYMMAAGDVTYEASHVPTSIFHSGWELVRTSKRFRALAVLSIQSSQKPVYMTAFGVIALSHQNFISVIRSSYSFFAVMY